MLVSITSPQSPQIGLNMRRSAPSSISPSHLRFLPSPFSAPRPLCLKFQIDGCKMECVVKGRFSLLNIFPFSARAKFKSDGSYLRFVGRNAGSDESDGGLDEDSGSHQESLGRNNGGCCDTDGGLDEDSGSQLGYVKGADSVGGSDESDGGLDEDSG